MPESHRKSERLIGMLIVGVIALNYPLLSLFSKIKLIFGIPMLYLYLFLFWAIFIICVALILEKRGNTPFTTPLKKKEKSG
jgi:hypothetical protein